MDGRTTLAEFTTNMKGVPGAENLIRRLCVRTFTEFVEVLHSDLDQIIQEMEREPDRHTDKCEDSLTYHIAHTLRERYYDAHQGVRSGGAVDLTVKGKSTVLPWTGEAKIFHSITAVAEGFKQLDTRYRPADVEQAKVGMLIYIKRPRSADLMKDWRNRMATLGLNSLETTGCSSRPNLAFYSSHVADYSGLPVSTRHMGVTLYHIPEDKSGRTAAKHVKAKLKTTSSDRPTG